MTESESERETNGEMRRATGGESKTESESASDRKDPVEGATVGVSRLRRDPVAGATIAVPRLPRGRGVHLPCSEYTNGMTKSDYFDTSWPLDDTT